MNKHATDYGPLELLSADVQHAIESGAEAQPGWADYQNRLGLLLLLRGKFPEALKTFERSLEINPEYAWAAVNRAQAIALCGNAEAAIRALDAAPRPAVGVKSLVSAFICLLQGEYSDGLSNLKDMSHPFQKRSDVRRLEAALTYQQSTADGDALWNKFCKEQEWAIYSWASLRKVEAGSPWLATFVPGCHQLFLEASTTAVRLGQQDEAQQLASAMQVFWGDESTHLTQRAFLLDFSGDGDGAVALYEAAIHKNPNSPRAHIALAYHWSAGGELDEAGRSLSKALRLAPRYADLHYQMGLLSAAKDDTPKALSSFQEALRINPRYAVARMQEAATLFELEEWDASRSAYLKVLEHGFESADIYRQLGQAQSKLGQTEEAERSFRRALALGQATEQETEVETELDQARDTATPQPGKRTGS